MQPQQRVVPGLPHAAAAPPQARRARLGWTSAARQARGHAWRVAPALRLRAARAPGVGPAGGGATGPSVEPQPQPQGEGGEEEAGDAELEAEELEVLEEAAIAGVDQGRRPTDYDRRAHIFEESSRMFRALKHRHDGDGGSESGQGDVAAGATAAETAARHQQQQQLG